MADSDKQETAFDRRKKATAANPSMAVVGVGVSAASLRSLGQLFSTLSVEVGAAYLVAVRQQEGLDVATVVELLTQQSPFAVKIAADGEALEPNHVYVGGPEDIVTIVDGHVQARPSTEPLGHRGTIDSMLISLSEHAHDRAIAVLLASLNSDGTAGVTATKQFGGLSIAELSPGEGPEAGAVVGPRAVVDLHLPVDEIAAQIALYAASLTLVSEGQDTEEVAHEIERALTQLTTLLRNVTGHDFHGYKRGTFVRRVQRRMQVMQIGGIDAYVARLQADRDEVQNLFQDLLIGVTQFFRDPAEFEALEREVPRLFEGKGPGDSFRVWVLGCATGEEAYSLAILLREHMATLDHPPEVQIFATDLDARALGLARAGRYAAEAIQGHVRPDRLERWFVREGATYCVSKELREMCIFSPHNIVKDAPFSRIDILSCRNLLIYLNGDLQNRVIPIFHFSLRPGGVLFLGSSENVTRHQKLFAPVDRKNRVFRRLETATRVIPDFPLTPRQPKTGSFDLQQGRPDPPNRLTAPVGRQAEAVAERYAPAYVVVDLQGDVLHFSGRTGRYLEPTTGAASLNLANLVHRDLRLDLRTALSRALSEVRRIELPRLLLKQEDRTWGVNLIVEPVAVAGEVTSLVVVFQDTGFVSDDAGADGDRLATDEQVQRLEAELRVTRDRLQATIEELESTNEELKSSNEEYQSINEELQSANEEMETSKEELQSINEELQTVNSELAHRVTELASTNSDIKNLLESTQIATVFLDNDLRVRNFTPAVTEVFHLLETDVGRPLDHVVSRVAYPELAEDARRVLRTLVPIEREVADPVTGRHFSARVLPYRSVDNYIGGAVVTFGDMTAVHKAQAAVREREADLARVQRVGKVGGVNVDVVDGLSGWRSPEYLSLHGLPPDVRRETHAEWRARVLPEDRDAAERALFAALEGDGDIYDSVYRIVRPDDGALRWIHARADIERDAERKPVRLVGAHVDITDRKIVEEALSAIEVRQRALIDGIPQIVWRGVEDGRWTWASPQWTEFTGQEEARSLDYGWLDTVHPDDRDAVRAIWAGAVERGEFEAEYRIRRQEDEERYRWFQSRAHPVRNDAGEVIEWLGTCTDVQDLRSLQELQRVLLFELQHRVRNTLSVVRAMAASTGRTSDTVEDFAAHLEGRLHALARTQVVLTRAPSQGVDLESLVREELLAQAAGEAQIDVGGPDVSLSPKAAEVLALAVHELATNAVKYGALTLPEGRVAVGWTLSRRGAETWLELTWEESGVRVVSNGPRREGFGTELIQARVPYELRGRGELQFRPGGVRCEIAFPLLEGGSILQTSTPER